jgi:hypothetical protein
MRLGGSRTLLVGSLDGDLHGSGSSASTGKYVAKKLVATGCQERPASLTGGSTRDIYRGPELDKVAPSRRRPQDKALVNRTQSLSGLLLISLLSLFVGLRERVRVRFG